MFSKRDRDEAKYGTSTGKATPHRWLKYTAMLLLIFGAAAIGASVEQLVAIGPSPVAAEPVTLPRNEAAASNTGDLPQPYIPGPADPRVQSASSELNAYSDGGYTHYERR